MPGLNFWRVLIWLDDLNWHIVQQPLFPCLRENSCIIALQCPYRDDWILLCSAVACEEVRSRTNSTVVTRCTDCVVSNLFWQVLLPLTWDLRTTKKSKGDRSDINHFTWWAAFVSRFPGIWRPTSVESSSPSFLSPAASAARETHPSPFRQRCKYHMEKSCMEAPPPCRMAAGEPVMNQRVAIWDMWVSTNGVLHHG